MTKEKLRKSFLNRRTLLTEKEYEYLNSQLLAQVIRFNFCDYNYLHCFLPIIKNKEPNTFSIIDFLRTTYPNLYIVISRTNFSTLSLKHYIFNKKTILSNNNFGITEPIDGEICSSDYIDIILIPLLTFDQHGHRIGYGKGIYDRFLTECRPNAVKVGLSLFEGIEHIDETNSFDQRLDYCITPTQIVQFSITSSK